MSQSSSKSNRISLLVVFLTVLIDLLGFGMVLPLIPVYARQIAVGYSATETAWLLGLLMVCYSIMQLLFAPLWGRLSDRVGRRPVLLLGLAGSTLFYGLFGVATMWESLPWMFAARIGGGIVGATIPTAQAYIADVTPANQRTRGMALIGVAFGLGFTLGPLLGALALITAADAGVSPWPGYTASILSGVALTLAIFKLRESLSLEDRRKPRTHLSLGSTIDLLSTPSIRLLLLILFLCNFGFSAFEGTLSLVLASFLGIERGGYQILLVFAYVGFIQTLVQGGLVRWMAKFTSECTLCAIGTVLAILGYALLAFGADPESGGTLLLMLGASVVVSGLGFIYPSVQSLLSRRSDPAKQGGILGTSSGLNSLARITGILFAMRILVIGPAIAFWVSAGLMIVSMVLIFIAVGAGKDWEAETSDEPSELGGGLDLAVQKSISE